MKEEVLKRFDDLVDSYEEGEDIEGIKAIELKRYHTKRVLKATGCMINNINILAEDKSIAKIIAILLIFPNSKVKT